MSFTAIAAFIPLAQVAARLVTQVIEVAGKDSPDEYDAAALERAKAEFEAAMANWDSALDDLRAEIERQREAQGLND